MYAHFVEEDIVDTFVAAARYQDGVAAGMIYVDIVEFLLPYIPIIGSLDMKSGLVDAPEIAVASGRAVGAAAMHDGNIRILMGLAVAKSVTPEIGNAADAAFHAILDQHVFSHMIAAAEESKARCTPVVLACGIGYIIIDGVAGIRPGCDVVVSVVTEVATLHNAIARTVPEVHAVGIVVADTAMLESSR